MARIFLVDDHAVMREGLRGMLESAGHEVVGEAADVDQALEELGRLQPQVVLLDLHLRGGSGLALLPGLRQRAPACKALVLSMSDQPSVRAQAAGQGAAGYVLKGSSRAELLHAIEAALEGPALTGGGAPEAGLARLSECERRIVALAAQGRSSQDIAEELQLTPRDVDTRRGRIMTLLGIRDLAGLVGCALQAGLIEADTAPGQALRREKP